MPRKHTVETRRAFFKSLGQGMAHKEACDFVGISENTGRAWIDDMKDSSGRSYAEKKKLKEISSPIPLNELRGPALKAFDDFGYFRRRFFGRIASNWQEDAAIQFEKLLWTPQKEYVVLNCPPGGGKSTLLHDIEAWLTVRNRAIRGLLGSATQRVALDYSRRLKRTLERQHILKGDPIEVAAGREVDAESTLPHDYGRFQPEQIDVWRAESFVIAQWEDVQIEEKESTWSAFGFDATYLGQRVNISVWDDVVTKRTLKTQESIEAMCRDWDNEAEKRIDPGGLIAVVGQRLHSQDIYAHCLQKLSPVEHEEEGDDDIAEPTMVDPSGSNIPRMYHHIKYPAHFEDRCKQEHSPRPFLNEEGKPTFKETKIVNPRAGKQWPEGCLLDPVRLPWPELAREQENNRGKYRVVFQQEDIDPGSVLVPRMWITGGRDTTTGEEFPGCYDQDRGLAEIPNLQGETISVITADPSPTNYWSVQWWIYHPASEYRFLIDLERRKMEAPDFLDWNYHENQFYGLAEDWIQRAKKLGKPIQYMIVEKNAAQRFLMQFDHFKRWQALHNVSVYGHETTSNKADTEFGVQTIAPHYRHGRIRLPNKATHGNFGFAASRALVEEVTRYPESATDDCVMAHWFLEWWLPRLVMPNIDAMPRRFVPSWMANAS